jgi:hypothetical protein
MRGQGIQRSDALHLKSHPKLEVILQVFPDARQILYDVDAHPLQPCAVSDS